VVDRALIPETISGTTQPADGDIMIYRSGVWIVEPISGQTVLNATNKQAPTIGTALVDLGDGAGNAGVTYVEGNALFTAAQVGKTVFIQPGLSVPGRADDEWSPIAMAASIVSTSRMVVRWASVWPVRGMVRVNYVIGS
jgi:hypothetical protein